MLLLSSLQDSYHIYWLVGLFEDASVLGKIAFLLLLAISLVILHLVRVSVVSNFRLWKDGHIAYMSALPGQPVRYPFVGNLPDMISGPFSKQPFKYHVHCRDLFGPVYKFWVFYKPIVGIHHVGDVNAIVGKYSKYFGKSFGYKGVMPWMMGEDALLLSEGELWQQQRSALNPAFHHSHLKVMDSTILNYCKQLGVIFGKSADSKTAIDVQESFKNFTLDVIGSVGFGYQFRCLSDTESKDQKAMAGVLLALQLRFRRILPNFLYYFADAPARALRERLRNNIGNMIDGRVERGLDEKDQDVIALMVRRMLEGDKTFTRESLINQGMLFLFAGSDTTSTTLTAAVSELALNPDAQEKLFNEIDSVLGSTPPTSDDVSAANMPYLDAVCKESMRLWPAAPFVGRQALKDLELPSGFKVKAGVNYSVIPYALHRMRDVWGDDADEFHPERWHEKKTLRERSMAFMPFLKGKRNCIGQQLALLEMRLCLVYLMQHFRFEPTEQIKRGRDTIMTITLSFADGMPVHIHRR
jgi:cytochrome P450